jgi:hypothetical protein
MARTKRFLIAGRLLEVSFLSAASIKVHIQAGVPFFYRMEGKEGIL